MINIKKILKKKFISFIFDLKFLLFRNEIEEIKIFAIKIFTSNSLYLFSILKNIL